MSQHLGEAIAGTLLCTLGVALLALSLGVALGALASRRTSVFAGVLRRLIELSGALPLFVAIPLLSSIWPATLSTVVVLGTYHGLRLACICRNQSLRANGEAFVISVRALGQSARRTRYRHVAPIVLPPLAVGGLLALPGVIGVEAALSYFQLADSTSFGGYLIEVSGSRSWAPLAAALLVLFGLHAWVERLISRILRCPG